MMKPSCLGSRPKNCFSVTRLNKEYQCLGSAFENQGTSYLFSFPLPFRLEWVKNPAKQTLQTGNKPLLTQRPAGALMPTYQNSLMVRHAGLKQRPPIVHQSQQGSNLYQSIIKAFHMRRRTAPWVQFRLLDKSSPDRIEFHIPGCRQKILFVHHKRGKL